MSCPKNNAGEKMAPDYGKNQVGGMAQNKGKQGQGLYSGSHPGTSQPPVCPDQQSEPGKTGAVSVTKKKNN